MRGSTRIPLAGLELDDFQGFPDFYHVTVKRRDGTTAANRNFSFCPNGDSARLRPDAPRHRRTRDSAGVRSIRSHAGAVWGIQEGWGTGQGFGDGPTVNLRDGRYTATLIITRQYRQLFGLSLADVRKTVTVRVMPGGDGCPPFCEGHVSGEAPLPQPASHEPGADVAIPPGTPMPDLRPLPAFDIGIDSRPNRGRDFLTFGANVWNAGPSPLVVDGFRRQTEDIMDAHQYFFDSDGNQVAHARVGTMAWDPRSGHHHWHFKDFARYRLLDASKQAIVRSRKEAFCLANTDAINYTVKGANWNPEGTDLETACGDHNSLAVREVLDSGSGDTYFQGLPGQSFEITSLPNGTYFIEVAANPARPARGVQHDQQRVVPQGDPRRYPWAPNGSCRSGGTRRGASVRVTPARLALRSASHDASGVTLQ